MKNTKEIIGYSIKLGSLLSFLYFVNSAIDKQTYSSLEERAGGRCESKVRNSNGKETHNRCSVTSNLEVAHMQHGDNKRYNRLSNLKLYCTRCHYLDHLHRRRNNLSRGENDWTLYQLWNRMTPQEKEGLIEPPIPKKNNKYKNRRR